MSTFGERLKYYRSYSKLTQEELAKRCGMKKQSISRYEKSEREPNIQIAKRLADALNVSLESLTDEDYIPGLVVEPVSKWTDRDARLLMWFRSLPKEKQQAILFAQDAPEDLV